MNSRERVLTAINHEEPDKVPLDSWMAPEVASSIVKFLNIDLENDRFALAKALGHDLLYTDVGFCDGFNSIFKEERKIEGNLYQDPWGIKWIKKSQQYGSYCEFAEHPLADIKNYDNYKWADPLVTEKESLKVYKELIDKEGQEYAILGSVACTMWEASWYLRGLEQFLVDLYENRDFVIELLDRTMNYSLEVSKRLVEMGVDIIWWGDDIGDEKGPFISPEMFRELIKPRYAFMIQEVKKISKDIKIAFHTDGNVEWALDDLIEIGVDILNPLQPDVNDVPKIKKKYGDKLTFWGNVDTRNVMSIGTAVDVAREVRNVISTLGPGGGLILCSNHTIQATERAVDNTIAYYWAAEKFRNYPINIKENISDKLVYWATG